MISTISLILSFACQFIERLTDFKGKIALGTTICFCLSIAFAQEAFAVTAPTITPGSSVYSTYQSTATITATTGDQIFYSINGTNPTNLSTPYTVPIVLGATNTIKAIAYSGGVPSAITTSYIQSDVNSLPVPRTGMSLWLRNFGAIVSGSNITQWSDLSGSSPANNATQATSTKQATVVTSAINGINAGLFNGTSRNYVLTNQLTDLTGGFSIFAVIKPVGTATKTFFASANAGPSNLVSLETVNNQVRFNAYNGVTASNVITPAASLTVGKYQIVDAVHNGAASASIAINGTTQISGTVQNLVNIARTQNVLGANNTITTYWNGELAELLVYSRGVTETERKAIQAFLFNRYQIDNATVVATPIISVPTSTLTEPTEVAIATPTAGAVTKYTLDGTTPSISSATYQAPVRINFTQSLKAISIKAGISSAVATSTLTLDATRWPAPSATDLRPLQLNLQLPTTAIPQ
ncbi:MAG: trimeric autotransporter adhesin [Cyanobacteriota bacterium erpe_2018_sw_39hr_WHONDRS-SW48-000098_B_bin.30]|nr:trimeric autotransporter adhesin [Cyanobacteriota bacterium erpe_2018_sw_39hr_WHONDRS-SW48-000098_B_bin.30]